MGSILDWLGLGNPFSGSPTAQQPRADVTPQGPAEIKPTGMQAADASTSAGGAAKPNVLSDTMMKLLMASILSNPTPPPQAPAGGPAPVRPQPFQYTPMSAMAVGPRARL